MESGCDKLWMIGLVFTTIILLQYFQVPIEDLFLNKHKGVILKSEEDVRLENGVPPPMVIAASSRDSGLAFEKKLRNASSEKGETIAKAKSRSSGLAFGKKERNKSLENGETTVTRKSSGLAFGKKKRNSSLENGETMPKATRKSSGLAFAKRKRNSSLEKGEKTVYATKGVSVSLGNATSRKSGLAFEKRKRNKHLDNGEAMPANASKKNGLENGVSVSMGHATSRNSGLAFEKRKRNKTALHNGKAMPANVNGVSLSRANAMRTNGGSENGVSVSMANATSRKSGLAFQKKKHNRGLENGETMANANSGLLHRKNVESRFRF